MKKACVSSLKKRRDRQFKPQTQQDQQQKQYKEEIMVQIKSIATTTKKNLFDFCCLRVMTLNPKRNKCHLSILPGCPMNHLYSHNNLFLPTLESAYKASTQAS